MSQGRAREGPGRIQGETREEPGRSQGGARLLNENARLPRKKNARLSQKKRPTFDKKRSTRRSQGGAREQPDSLTKTFDFREKKRQTFEQTKIPRLSTKNVGQGGAREEPGRSQTP